jgi:hypothetical protein
MFQKEEIKILRIVLHYIDYNASTSYESSNDGRLIYTDYPNINDKMKLLSYS